MSQKLHVLQHQIAYHIIVCKGKRELGESGLYVPMSDGAEVLGTCQLFSITAMKCTFYLGMKHLIIYLVLPDNPDLDVYDVKYTPMKPSQLPKTPTAE